MKPSAPACHPLAPLQAAMLRDRGVSGQGREVMQAELVFQREISPERVREAWRGTVAAVTALRSGFIFEEGTATGWTERAVPGEWREFPDAAGPAAGWWEEDRREDFPWMEGVPWRVSYWPSAGRWVWTFHHGLLDGRSITRILQGFLCRVQGLTAPDLRAVIWEPAPPARIGSAALWFQEQLAGAGATAPDFRGGTAGTVAVCGGEDLVRALKAVSRAHGVTPAKILVWAWGQVVARAAGTKTVILGQVRAGPPVGDAAGFSMNTLPVPVPRAASGTTAEAWEPLRTYLLALRDWENLAPEDLPVMQQQVGSPWASVIMVENGTLFHELGEVAARAITGAALHEKPGPALIASAYMEPDIRLEVTCDAALGTGAAQSLVDHWLAILQRCGASPLAPAAETVRLPEAVEARLAALEDGGPALPGPVHLAAAWQEARKRYAGGTALWTPGGSLSYEAFGQEADRLAGSLRSAGVQAGQIVAVQAGRHHQWPLALIAVLGLSAVYLPLGPRIAPRRLRAMVEQGTPALLLGGHEGGEDFGLPKAALDAGAPAAIALTSAAGFSGTGRLPPGQQPMALLYTSGSTGEPKGVVLEHGGVLNEARWVIRLLGLGPGDRMLQFSSPGFDASLEEMLSCLLSGATLVPRPEEAAEDIEVFHDFIGTAAVTVLDLPTAFWSAWSGWMREHGRSVPASVRATIIGGEGVTVRALTDWRATGGRALWNCYGPTETSIVATAHEIGESWQGPEDPPIGRPLPGYRVRVAGPDGEPMPPGATGEIWIGGPSVGPGYFRRDDLTANVFVTRDGLRWYRTGDLARWDGEGRLRFLGRLDDQLKIRGHRIEPGEVIRLLEQHPQVAAAHAGAWEGASPPVMAAWVRWEGAPPEDWPKVLRAWLEPRLPAAALPVRWAAVEAFILTERGKLDRRALPVPEAAHHTAWEAPATPTEQRLAARWSSLLGMGRVGRRDSFFDLGGHSLAALHFFAWLRAEFGTPLPMTTLFSRPTLAGLAQAVDDSLQTGAGAAAGAGPTVEAVSLRETGQGLPLFCVHGGDGGVLLYRNLAAHLPEHQSVATIEAPALGSSGPLEMGPVEEAARQYVAAIRRRQQAGPYHLAGYSFGGVLVYEMAAQLRKAGESVAFVGLFDTENPSCRWRRYRPAERLRAYWSMGGPRPWWQRSVRLATRIVSGVALYLPKRLQLWAARRQRDSAPYSRVRAIQVRAAHAAAMEAYQPPPVDIPVVLFRTRASDERFAVPPDYGWSHLTPALEAVDCAGEHLTMFSEAHAPALARAVAARLPCPDKPAASARPAGTVLGKAAMAHPVPRSAPDLCGTAASIP